MKRILLPILTLIALALPARAMATGEEDRAYSVHTLTRIAGPVLEAMSENQLHEQMPLHDWEKGRAQFRLFEAFARTLSGVAPWLALGPYDSEEGKLRARFSDLARRSLVNATDPKAPDFCNFHPEGNQPLVEAAYLADALMRAPAVLWEPLTPEQKANVIAALKETRQVKPPNSNWVLFASMVEAGLWQLTGEHDAARLEYGVNFMMGSYVGDGTYGDGKPYHWDYYNSYVIQPMLLDVLRVCKAKNDPLGKLYPKALGRARRYGEVQERLISPEGTFPVIGRSSVYRFAAFRHLSYLALEKELPASLKPGTTRAAITAVVRRMIEAPGTFDDKGWLQIGVVGCQPDMRDTYNNTGSLYICTTGLISLGLPPSDPFWSEPAGQWTQQRIWSGQEAPHDHPYEEPKEP